MKVIKPIFAFLIIFIQIGVFQKLFSSDISAGAQFLRIGLGARAAGMGEAFAGIADDVNAIAYNPAGLVQVKNPEIIFLHTQWLEGINIEYFAIADAITSKTSIGGGFFYLSSGEIEKVNRYGDSANESYTVTDTILVFSVAREIRNNIFLGCNIKSISQKIEKEQSKRLCFDIGAILRLSKLKTGISIQNLGARIKFINATEPLPLNIKVGINYSLLDNLQLDLDINIPKDRNLGINFGCEYLRLLFKNTKVAIRAGYKTYSVGNLSVGSGLYWKNWELNYAFVPYEGIFATHRIDLLKKFGNGKPILSDSELATLIVQYEKEIKSLENKLTEEKKLKNKLQDKKKEFKNMKIDSARKESELKEKIKKALSEKEAKSLQEQLEQENRLSEELRQKMNSEVEKIKSETALKKKELEDLQKTIKKLSKIQARKASKEKKEAAQERKSMTKTLEKEAKLNENFIRAKEEEIKRIKAAAAQRESRLMEQMNKTTSTEETKQLQERLEQETRFNEKTIRNREVEIEQMKTDALRKEEELKDLRKKLKELEKSSKRKRTRPAGTYEEALKWYREKIKTSNLSTTYKTNILEKLVFRYKKIRGRVPEMEKELNILKGTEK